MRQMLLKQTKWIDTRNDNRTYYSIRKVVLIQK